MQSPDMERAVLGAVLLSSAVLEPLLTEVRLKPAHFHVSRHRIAFKAMCDLFDQGREVDLLTLTDAVRNTEAGKDPEFLTNWLEALPAECPSLTGARSYAQRVVELAAWREEQHVGFELIEAAETEDRERRDKAIAVLMRPSASTAEATSDRAALGRMIWEHLESGEDEAWGWPELPKLTDLTLGGRRRGGVTVIGGHTGFGKSVWLDQILEADGKDGLNTWLYLNEMTRHERTCRVVSRLTGLSVEKIMRNRLTEPEKSKVAGVLSRIPFGMTDAAGWSAEEIARDALGRDLDSIGVDIMHNIDYTDESDLKRIILTFKNLAAQAKAHVLVTVHLNTRRLDKAVKPPPVSGDIRGSGMIANLADNVMFVHRQQDERSGFPEDGGWIYFTKVRTGTAGGVRTYFDGGRVRFTQAAGAEYEDGVPDA